MFCIASTDGDGGSRPGGYSRTSRFVVALFLVLGLVAILASCADDGCVDPHPCGAQNTPYVFSLGRFNFLEPSSYDTTEVVFRFLAANGIPKGVQWASTIGHIAPKRKCTAVCYDSTGSCLYWEVEEIAAWVASPGDSFSEGTITIDYPALGSDSCDIAMHRFAAAVFAYAGRGVCPVSILSHPSGANIIFDGQTTDKSTKATLYIAEWWKSHLVKLELDGYEPDSLVIPAYSGPSFRDSFMLYLEPSDPS